MPKYPKLGGFDAFRNHMKPQFEKKEGRRISIDELRKKCDLYWRKMTQDEKQIWKHRAIILNTSPEFQEDRARQTERLINRKRLGGRKGKKKGSSKNDTTAEGEEPDSCERKVHHEPEEFMIRRYFDRIELTPFLCAAPIYCERVEIMQDLTFRVLSVSPYLEFQQKYPPAELAMVTFSVEKGVTESKSWIFPQLFNAGPAGVDSAQRWAKYHGISAEAVPYQDAGADFVGDAAGWQKILDEVAKSCAEDLKILVHSFEYNQVLGGLGILRKKCNWDWKTKEEEVEQSLSPWHFTCIEDATMAFAAFPTMQDCSDSNDEIEAEFNVDNVGACAPDAKCAFHCAREENGASCAKQRAHGMALIMIEEICKSIKWSSELSQEELWELQSEAQDD